MGTRPSLPAPSLPLRKPQLTRALAQLPSLVRTTMQACSILGPSVLSFEACPEESVGTAAFFSAASRRYFDVWRSNSSRAKDVAVEPATQASANAAAIQNFIIGFRRGPGKRRTDCQSVRVTAHGVCLLLWF